MANDFEKDIKVLNKINFCSYPDGTVAGRHKGIVPKDEYSISMKAITDELAFWASLKKFEGKNIICPFDCDIVDGENIYAMVIDYDTDNTDEYSLGCSIEVYRCDGDIVKCEKIDDDLCEEFIYDKLSCNFLKVLASWAKKWKIKSITASGMNTSTGVGFDYRDIDFSIYDICITNPPRSEFSNFVQKIVGQIDFIITAPFFSRGHNTPIKYLWLKQAFLGNCRRIKPEFINKCLEDTPVCKDLWCYWLVSFPEKQHLVDKTRMSTTISYDIYKEDYPVMENITMKDGTHPILVRRYDAIPDDYDGWMRCAAGALDVLSNEGFEWYPTTTAEYFNEINPDASPYAHKVHPDMMKVSWQHKVIFDGIVIRRRSTLSECPQI